MSDSTYQAYLNNPKKVPQRVYYETGAQNIIKTDIVSVLDGHIPFICEHRFNNYFALSLGPGLILPISVLDLFGSENSNTMLSYLISVNPTFRQSGASFHIEPILYPEGESGTSYWSCFYKAKFFATMRMTEFGFVYGYNNFNYKNINYQTSLALSFVNQLPYRNVSDIKYLSSQGIDQNNLSEYGVPEVNTIRLSLRIYLGYILDKHIKTLTKL